MVVVVWFALSISVARRQNAVPMDARFVKIQHKSTKQLSASGHRPSLLCAGAHGETEQSATLQQHGGARPPMPTALHPPLHMCKLQQKDAFGP